MKKFSIANRQTGTDLGTFEGADEAAALNAMARDAGYADYAAAQDVAYADEDELIVTEVKPFEVIIKTVAPGVNAHVNAIGELAEKHGVQTRGQYRGPADAFDGFAIIADKATNAYIAAVKALDLPKSAVIRG